MLFENRNVDISIALQEIFFYFGIFQRNAFGNFHFLMVSAGIFYRVNDRLNAFEKNCLVASMSLKRFQG